MAPRRRVRSWAGEVPRLLAYVTCFGLIGLIWSLPWFRRRRRRRSRTCTTCARHHRIATVVLTCLTVLLVVGGLTRVQAGTTEHIRCHSQITDDGDIRPEPPLPHVEPHPARAATRAVLVAPSSGLALLGGRAAGMSTCSTARMLVTFWAPPRSSGGGTVVGDVFVSWIPAPTPGNPVRYGIARETGSMRYGPNISRHRGEEAALVRHESRHIDQWAFGSIVAGPLSFPVLYFVDEAFFPLSRNHFERAAGLAGGGYPPAPDNWPAPHWPEVTALLVVAALLARRRIRWTSRRLLGGREEASARAPQRCSLHTKGWRRARTSPDRS